MFKWLVKITPTSTHLQIEGLRKEAGENSYAGEAVPQRCVESQW